MADSDSERSLPAGSCDCHMHIIDRRFPFAKGALPLDREARVEDYRRLQARYGLQRLVVVQATYYGTDNSCVLESLREFGAGMARGVVVVDSDVSLETLRRFRTAGVQGIRCRMTDRPVVAWEDIPALAKSAAELGWHVQFQMDGRRLHEREDMIRSLPCDVVIEHGGKFMEPVDAGHPGFAALLRLLDTGKVWVKLSGIYNTSLSGPPLYSDLESLTKTLVRHAPEKMVWASDWPFVLTADDELPDVGDLIGAMLRWVPDEETRRKIFSDNAAHLYKFSLT